MNKAMIVYSRRREHHRAVVDLPGDIPHEIVSRGLFLDVGINESGDRQTYHAKPRSILGHLFPCAPSSVRFFGLARRSRTLNRFMASAVRPSASIAAASAALPTASSMRGLSVFVNGERTYSAASSPFRGGRPIPTRTRVNAPRSQMIDNRTETVVASVSAAVLDLDPARFEIEIVVDDDQGVRGEPMPAEETADFFPAQVHEALGLHDKNRPDGPLGPVRSRREPPGRDERPDRSARKTYPGAFAKRSATRNPTLCRVSSYRAPGFPRPTTTLKSPPYFPFSLAGAAPASGAAPSSLTFPTTSGSFISGPGPAVSSSVSLASEIGGTTL